MAPHSQGSDTPQEPRTLAELFASWGSTTHTIDPHEPGAFNELAFCYVALLQLAHRHEARLSETGEIAAWRSFGKTHGFECGQIAGTWAVVQKDAAVPCVVVASDAEFHERLIRGEATISELCAFVDAHDERNGE